jgi:hypothetical protein
MKKSIDPFNNVHLTVSELKKRLNEYPDDAIVCAYEGEVVGIGISIQGKQIGFIETDLC